MDEQKDENLPCNSPGGCLLRLFWMLIGNAILLLCVCAILQHRTGGFSTADAVYWALVGALLAARYVDIRYFRGMTSDGNPATMADWRRYATILGGVSAAVWLGANAIAHYGA